MELNLYHSFFICEWPTGLGPLLPVAQNRKSFLYTLVLNADTWEQKRGRAFWKLQ